MIIPKVRDPKEFNSMLPQQIAELKTEEDPEAKPFLISFQKYNKRLCQIDNLPKNCPKKALHDLKKIGQDIISFKDFENNGIKAKPIRKANSYKELFKGLHEDVDLYEHMLNQTARMFYFANEPEKIIYIVAITNTHLETDKVRR